MLFTIMYFAITIRTSLRFRAIRNSIKQILTDRYAVSFYTTSNGGSIAELDSPDASTAVNVSSCIWYFPDQRGCLVYPVRRITIADWFSVPEELKSHIEYAATDPNNGPVQLIVTLERLAYPATDPSTQEEEPAVMLNRFGRFVAWRNRRRLEVLLETDTTRLFQLIVATFGSGRFELDSGRLKLVQLESVETLGEPVPFDESITNYSSDSLAMVYQHSFSTDAWLTALHGLKRLEDEHHSTNYPTVGVQPDIISSNDIKISLETMDGTVLSSQSRADLLSSGSNSRNRSQLDLTDGLISGSGHGHNDAAEEPEERTISRSTTEELVKDAEKDTPICGTAVAMVNDGPEKAIVVAPPLLEDLANAKDVLPTPTEEPPKKANTEVTSNGTAKHPDKSPNPKPNPPLLPSPLSAKNEASGVPPPLPPSAKTIRSLRKSSFPSSRLRLGQPGVITKPPNILVHSDSSSTMEYVIATLNELLEPNTYTIYPITTGQAMTSSWQQSTVLIIVAGTLDTEVRKILLDYFLHGGTVFSLCSDLLDIILPDSKTAEIRERELVSFSYRKWKQIKMLHHIFCYQLSPAKKQFSLESEETSTLLPISYVDVADRKGKPHSLAVEILAQEETWNTPSILEAHNRKTGGRAIFSQIHLELDPSLFQSNIDAADNSLQNSNQLRYEILSDLLGSRFGLKLREKSGGSDETIVYKNSYFLGKHEAKVAMLDTLKSTMSRPNVIQTSELTLQFCGKGDSTSTPASDSHLPVMIFHCPEDFSTVEYFDNLTTHKVGRIGIYAPIMTSSMQIVSNLTLAHGFMVIARYQTKGKGRNNNQWLSPPGCAMFSLQLHIPMNSMLGQRLPIVQHLVAISVVSAIISLPGYEKLDLGLKWPNDIYAYGASKLGGSIFNTQVDATVAIVNVGVGLNLSNSKPTLCLNDVIAQYNAKHSSTLPLLSYEKTFALIFNKLEELYDRVQREGIEVLQQEYYRHWLHQDAEISMIGTEGESLQGTIVGIDEYGFLLVKKQPSGETLSVHPDGNSFDMMQGLIVPKFN
ncbi:biotin--protein ligase isoform X2 [Anopheles maculipalpis]|uniref:biotin--protein ligase isoform X2 n=1 Tax=Anopheles maculipalpis TaxID=1496333 RepID=UPI00215918BC|nr:biotin--protein ligase isoform X2 [Anopheles maculipalpis]